MSRTTGLVVGVGLVMLGAFSAVAAPPPRVEYRNDRLSVHAEGAPLQSILDEIQKQSGAELRGAAPADATVNMDVDAVPLREALERLLGAQSFTLTYGDGGRLKTLELRGGPTEAPAAKPEGPKPVNPHSRKAMWDGLARVFNDPQPIPVSGRLAEVAGGDKASWEKLFRTAGQNDDRDVRRQVWRAGMRAIEADQNMRNALVTAVGVMDDGELTDFARALAAQTPDGAEDLAKVVARESRIPEVRDRARTILRRLRTERLANAQS